MNLHILFSLNILHGSGSYSNFSDFTDFQMSLKFVTSHSGLPDTGNDITLRSSHRRCSVKKIFLKILQNSQVETPVVE